MAAAAPLRISVAYSLVVLFAPTANLVEDRRPCKNATQTFLCPTMLFRTMFHCFGHRYQKSKTTRPSILFDSNAFNRNEPNLIKIK